MSKNPLKAAEHGEIEVEAGRPSGFSQLGDWVALSGATDHAKALYWHLAMHVNIKRGDRAVWPSKASLAAWMKFKRADKIDPYIQELVSLGAIEVIHRRVGRMKTRNKYVVHLAAPDDYTGPRTLKDWYDRENERSDKTQAHDVVPSKGLREHPTPAKTNKTPGQHVAPSRGVRSPLQGVHVVLPRGPELYEVELDENPSLTSLPRSVSDTHDEEGVRDQNSNEFTNKPSVEALELVAGLPWGDNDRLRPSQKQITQLAVAFDLACANGWEPKRLRSYCSQALSESISKKQKGRVAYMQRALTEYLPPPPSRQAPNNRLQLATEATEIPLTPEAHAEAKRSAREALKAKGLRIPAAIAE